MSDKTNYYLISMVAIVAIVGIVVLFSGSNQGVTSPSGTLDAEYDGNDPSEEFYNSNVVGEHGRGVEYKCVGGAMNTETCGTFTRSKAARDCRTGGGVCRSPNERV